MDILWNSIFLSSFGSTQKTEEEIHDAQDFFVQMVPDIKVKFNSSLQEFEEKIFKKNVRR